MNTEDILSKFEAIGARVKVTERSSRMSQTPLPVTFNINTDKKGEFFTVSVDGAPEDIKLDVIDHAPDLRHLLLMLREKKEKIKYLCGHDERHWFIASLPLNNSIKTVEDAIESLKPGEVVASQKKNKVKAKHLSNLKGTRYRRNKAFLRQGEWFFVPTDREIPEKYVLKNEPIRRGRGKPHMCEFLYREGGTNVMVHHAHAPNGVTPEEYKSLLLDPSVSKYGWRHMKRDMTVYVRGNIKHPDHSPVYLDKWCRVLPNRESVSKNVAFLD
jgi:hypothetical protein